MLLSLLPEPLRTFLGVLASHDRRRTTVACLYLVLQGLTEGVGLVLLVPFLLLVGSAEAGEESGGVVGFVRRLFESFGLPLDLPTVLIAFVVLVALRSWLLAKSGHLLTRIQLGFVNGLRARMFAAVGGASWRFLVRRRMSDLQHAMAQDVNRISLGAREALNLLVNATLALAYAGAAIRVSPATTAIAAGIGILVEGVRWPLIRRARELGQAMTSIQREAFALVSEFMQGLKPIKARGLEDRHHQAYLGAIERIESQRLEYSRVGLRAHAIHQVLLALALAGLVYVAATRLGVNTAELLVVVFIFARLMPLLSKLHQGYVNLVEALPAFESADRICRELETAGEDHRGRAEEPLHLARELCFENVSVRYGEADESPALGPLSFTLAARRTMGVVGASGAGKTTLVDVILGLLVPDAGRVTVDGEPLSDARLAAWRRSVAYVPQDTFLLHDTIAANLRWMEPEADEASIWDALRRAAAEDFVRRLPDGLETIVGDRGMRLSGGERQRIALARALLTHPQLLILDEATSQIDAENERQILCALDLLHGEITVVIIAHRPSLLRHVDDVLMLEEGRLVELGSRAELLAENSRLSRWLAFHDAPGQAGAGTHDLL